MDAATKRARKEAMTTQEMRTIAAHTEMHHPARAALMEAAYQIDKLRERIHVDAYRFRHPKYGCEWEDAAQECDSTLEATGGPYGQEA